MCEANQNKNAFQSVRPPQWPPLDVSNGGRVYDVTSYLIPCYFQGVYDVTSCLLQCFFSCVCVGGGSNQGVFVWGSLSRGVSVWQVSGGVSVQRRGLCPEEGSLSKGGVSVQRGFCLPPPTGQNDRLLKTLPSLAVGNNELKQFRIQNSCKRHQRTTICEEKKFQIKEYETKLLFFSMSLHCEPCDYK